MKPLTKTRGFRQVTAEDFKITDSNYGTSYPRYKCNICCFVQCDISLDVKKMYSVMIDEDYAQGENERALQSDATVKLVTRISGRSSGVWLDLGCASGILMESAINHGFKTIGIEISDFLLGLAQAKGLEVYNDGVESDKWEENSFDVISIIDVIEHVDNPNEIISNCYRLLKSGGILVLATPDNDSVSARLLRSKWWHVRVAHIGYFNYNSLKMLLTTNAFHIVEKYRPAWYFQLSYIIHRISVYLPISKILIKWAESNNFVVKVNLRDSLGVICEK